VWATDTFRRSSSDRNPSTAGPRWWCATTTRSRTFSSKTKSLRPASSASCPQRSVMPNTPTELGGAGLTGLLTVMQLSDSALPTGSFSHSFGMETYQQRGTVDSAASYTAWATGYLHQVAYTEGLAVRLTHEAAV